VEVMRMVLFSLLMRSSFWRKVSFSEWMVES
jgi:hypothetical protein